LNTIEQAARRLEQLRQAGVDAGNTVVPPASGATADAEPLPVRLARELESQGRSPVTRRDAAQEPEAAAQAIARQAEREAFARSQDVPIARAEPGTRVEIDLARLSANGFITPNAPRSRLAEEFRVIKRPLLMNARGKSAAPVQNANRIMVTSAAPGEGKTYVSVNLAMSLALEFDTSVLLVDADASRPAVLDRLGLPPAKGLLDLLVDPSLPLESVLLATNVDRLSVLPAGTQQSHATELLASDAMSRLVARLSAGEAGRIVLFDTPPLLAASESRVLAAHMGQVIMVIAADDTPQGSVVDALASVENCPVVVTLLNKVSPSDSGNYYGSYGS
jgi:exopolysaccharide/PEP-CTERM locus tyrosine autokinase